MDIKEYKEQYPELAKETLQLLKEQEDILKEIKVKEPKTKAHVDLKKLYTLATRLRMAVELRYIGEEGWIPVLDDITGQNKQRDGEPCGLPLEKVSKEQKRAYLIQSRIKALNVWYPEIFDREEE